MRAERETAYRVGTGSDVWAAAAYELPNHQYVASIVAREPRKLRSRTQMCERGIEATLPALMTSVHEARV